MYTTTKDNQEERVSLAWTSAKQEIKQNSLLESLWAMAAAAFKERQKESEET